MIPFSPVARSGFRSGKAGRAFARLGVGAFSWAALAGPIAAQQLDVQTGVSIRPDTVRIGDPFIVTVAVRAPRGAAIEFPGEPDSTTAVQALNPRAIVAGARSDAAFLEQQAIYRVAAWDVGEQPVLSGEVVVRLGGLERRIPIRDYTVFVASVLPADSALRVPKPARPLIEQRAIPWWLWLLLAAAIGAAWLLWRWLRGRRRRNDAIALDPYEHAREQFARVESLRLLETGNGAMHVDRMTDVLRRYLAARFPLAPMSTTSTELLTATRAQPTVVHDRLMRLLNESDLIKFGGGAVPVDRAREIGAEARDLVEHEHAASLEGADAVAPRQDAAA